MIFEFMKNRREIVVNIENKIYYVERKIYYGLIFEFMKNHDAFVEMVVFRVKIA